jgi:hypothetical protein
MVLERISTFPITEKQRPKRAFAVANPFVGNISIPSAVPRVKNSRDKAYVAGGVSFVVLYSVHIKGEVVPTLQSLRVNKEKATIVEPRLMDFDTACAVILIRTMVFVIAAANHPCVTVRP